MNKIWIVLKSEFLRRVQSKWFILSTLLAPLVFIALMILPAVIGFYTAQSEQRTIALKDETGVLLPRIEQASDGQLRFLPVDATQDSLRKAVMEGAYDGYLLLPAGLLAENVPAAYYAGEGGGLAFGERLEEIVDRAVEEQQLAERAAPPEILEVLRRDVSVRMFKLTPEGAEARNAGVYTLIGFFMGFIIYIAMFIYGSQVMYGVMEEKASRVVEVIISSVKPFHLLMGKVLGIGAMGLVQMVLWSVFILAGAAAAGSIIAAFLDPATFNLPDDASQEALLQAADFSIPALPIDLFVWFVLFFLGGYLLYASLFAAIGSAVEQQQDAQSFMLPVSMLIIIPIVFSPVVMESPNSTLAVILSLVPFFSPILMVLRIAVTEAPFWQIALSYGLLIGGFFGAVWLCGRIYRVGILMYGKKPSFKDLARWVRYA